MTAKPLGHEKGRARHRGHTDLLHLGAAGCDIQELLLRTSKNVIKIYPIKFRSLIELIV